MRTREVILRSGEQIALVPLTRCQFAIIDIADAELVGKMNWSARRQPNTFYAFRNAGNGRSELLHRLIMGAGSDDPRVDHRDGNGLNNRKENLRFCTHSQNFANMYRRRPKTGFRGVYQDRRQPGRWYARICFQFNKMHLGTFATPEEAAKAYDAAAVAHFGEFAHPNFPVIGAPL